MFFACGIWCVADIPSVSPSSGAERHSFYSMKGNTFTPIGRTLPRGPQRKDCPTFLEKGVGYF